MAIPYPRDIRNRSEAKAFRIVYLRHFLPSKRFKAGRPFAGLELGVAREKGWERHLEESLEQARRVRQARLQSHIHVVEDSLKTQSLEQRLRSRTRSAVLDCLKQSRYRALSLKAGPVSFEVDIRLGEPDVCLRRMSMRTYRLVLTVPNGWLCRVGREAGVMEVDGVPRLVMDLRGSLQQPQYLYLDQNQAGFSVAQA